MGKFTRWPWRYDGGHGIVFDANGDVVCDMLPTGDSIHDASAALIAAAPEMYEMLRMLVDNDSINDHSIDKEVMSLLAKARGE